MSSSPRILVVDDSESIRMTVKLSLQFKGYEVEEARDGLEALDLLRESACDLLITDLAMPGLGGIDLIRAARGELGLDRLPIIILSAEDRETKSRALAAGASEWVDKPFAPQQIFDAVERLLGGAARRDA